MNALGKIVILSTISLCSYIFYKTYKDIDSMGEIDIDFGSDPMLTSVLK